MFTPDRVPLCFTVQCEMDSSSSSSSLSSSDAPSLSDFRSAVETTGTYSSHLSLISALRQSGDLQALRLARVSFSDAYPLYSTDWLSWFDDELRTATSSEALSIFNHLCPRAINDAPIPTMHAKMLDIGIQLYKEQCVSKEKIQQIVRKCIWTGAVFGDNGELWKKCNGVAEMIGMNMDNSEREKIGDDTREGIKVFQQRLEKCEQKDEREMIWRSFVQFAKGVGIEGIIIATWERFLEERRNDPMIWEQYLRHLLEIEINRNGFVHWVIGRALRWVKHGLPIWECKMLTATSMKDIFNIMEDIKPIIMTSQDLPGAEAFVKVCWIKWRELTNNSDDVNRLVETLGYNIKGSEEWRRCCIFAAGILNDAGLSEVSRMILNMIEEVNMKWWIEMGRLNGREAFSRGVGSLRRRDQVEWLGEEWLKWEIIHKEGTCNKDLAGARRRIRECVNKITSVGHDGTGQTGKGRREVGARNRPRRKRVRRGTEDEGQEDGAEMVMMIGVGSAGDAGKKSKQTVENKKRKEVEQKREENVRKGMERTNIVEDGETEPRTIFITMGYDVTAQDLQQVFRDGGEIKEVRVPKRRDGASKGIGYVEFVDESGVEQALKKDREKVRGRMIRVQRSKPRRAGEQNRGSGEQRGKGRRRRVLVGMEEEAKKDQHKHKDNSDDVEMKDGGLSQKEFREMFLGKKKTN